MSMNLKVYDNGDHTCIVWLPADEKAIPNCRGFTIRRILGGAESYLHGFVGFSDDDKLDPAAPWKLPLQRYMWQDYGVKPGDVVQYSVVPVVGPNKTSLKLSPSDASALTEKMTITGQMTPSIAAYFNKGIVAGQWVSRALAGLGKKAKLGDQIKAPGNALRNALSGLLRPAVLDMLADAKKSGGEVYAALYELNDPDLLSALKALGKKCHLVLANGAFKPPTNDENKAVRDELRSVVDLHDRLVTSGHFAHNKFLVVCDAAGKALRVLSGSTNWTMTGLCTQANNGVIVNDPDLANDFLNEWNLLKDAGNGYPDSLAKTNSTANSFQVDGCKITQWFAPTKGAPDLEYARKLINAAQDGILFLFFNPGAFAGPEKPAIQWTLLQNILTRHQAGTPNFDGGLYMRGVVNQTIPGLTSPVKDGAAEDVLKEPSNLPAHDPSAPAPVSLFSGGVKPPQKLTFESMVPANIKTAFHNWAAEIQNVGVHIHSKVIVIDPFGKNPVVMTGSHNLGFKASSKNDDNLMIVEGNAPLAAAFAANIIAIYQTYRWNAYVEAHRQDPRVWHGLVDNDSWQDGHLTDVDELAELKFWLGTPGAPPSAAAAAPVKAVTAGPAVAGGKKTTAKKRPAAKQKTAAKKKPAAKQKTVAKKKPAVRKKPVVRRKK